MLNENLIWVDPPSGWKYGFPKVYDRVNDPPMKEWLLANGLPEHLAKVDWVRCWGVEEDCEPNRP